MKLKKQLNFCVNSFKPDFVLYDAGIDIHKDDELGRINIDDDRLFRKRYINIKLKKNYLYQLLQL